MIVYACTCCQHAVHQYDTVCYVKVKLGKLLEEPHNSAAVLAISDSLTLHFAALELTRCAKVNGKKISGTDVDLHIEEPIDRSDFNARGRIMTQKS